MTAADCATVMRLGLEGAARATTPADEYAAWDAALAPFWQLDDPRDEARWRRFARVLGKFRAARARARSTGNGSE